jgi:hypothetical protein
MISNRSSEENDNFGKWSDYLLTGLLWKYPADNEEAYRKNRRIEITLISR